MTISQVQKTPQVAPNDEEILVVRREALFGTMEAWSGLKKVDFAHYLHLIQEKKEFLPRSLMEQNPEYKQIIPYLIFSHNDRYFLMQRTAQATEQRLQNKFSLGIGGHIRKEDMQTDSLFDWAGREFHEEVNYADSFEIEPLGMLNDDSNAVGQVHIGFVFLLKGNSSNISVRSELKSGQLVDMTEMQHYVGKMESWSQMVYEFLKL